jgi:hypothetical protein
MQKIEHIQRAHSATPAERPSKFEGAVWAEWSQVRGAINFNARRAWRASVSRRLD